MIVVKLTEHFEVTCQNLYLLFCLYDVTIYISLFLFFNEKTELNFFCINAEAQKVDLKVVQSHESYDLNLR